MAIAKGTSAANTKETLISKEVLQITAAKIGVTVPKPLEDDFTWLMADGHKVMEEVSAMDGARGLPVLHFVVFTFATRLAAPPGFEEVSTYECLSAGTGGEPV